MQEWFSRGYLPHRHRPGLKQHITYRLADSLPDRIWPRVAYQLEVLKNQLANEPEKEIDEKISLEKMRHIHEYLDAGHGTCIMKNRDAAQTINDALLKFDGDRYRIIAWCVMPNHVHVLIETWNEPVSRIIHSWKSFTANRINTLFNRTGQLWHREYYDRYIRDEGHLHATIDYIESNPVKAKLVSNKELWRFGSAWKDM